MKIYVVQVCTSDDICAEVEDPSYGEGLAYPQFAFAFAEFGDEQLEKVKRGAIDDLNDLFESQLTPADFRWDDLGWVRTV